MQIQPRLIRLRDAPAYLGMDRNRFNHDVRPALLEIRIGRQGVAFDRLELDAWGGAKRYRATGSSIAKTFNYLDKHRGQLTLHQDRGSPMTSNGFLGAMRALDITCSHSRPRVSNDNPISESAFKTLKYQPDYPGKFTSATHARRWCNDYYHWANTQHHHSGLNGYTPEQVLTGAYRHVAVTKQAALDRRFAQNPERFVCGRPIVKLPPSEVAINPITEEDIAEGVVDAVNFPTLRAAGYVSNAI